MRIEDSSDFPIQIVRITGNKQKDSSFGLDGVTSILSNAIGAHQVKEITKPFGQSSVRVTRLFCPRHV